METIELRSRCGATLFISRRAMPHKCTLENPYRKQEWGLPPPSLSTLTTGKWSPLQFMNASLKYESTAAYPVALPIISIGFREYFSWFLAGDKLNNKVVICRITIQISLLISYSKICDKHKPTTLSCLQSTAPPVKNHRKTCRHKKMRKRAREKSARYAPFLFHPSS